MGRTVEMRRKLDETKKSVVQKGLSTDYAATLKDGYYLINGETFTCEKLTAAEARKKYEEGSRLVLIPENTAKNLEIVSRVSQAELKEFTVSKMNSKIVATAEKSKKWSLGEDEMEVAAKAYALVGHSILGFYADVGASTEAKIKLKVGSFQLDVKAYAEVKAGVRVGVLGLAAQASAEVGIEDKLTAPKVTFKAGSYEVIVEFYACIKAFAKAEAYAGLGAKSGAKAEASVGVEGKIGADFYKKKEDLSSAGGASVVISIKVGVGAGAAAGFSVQDIMDGDVQYKEFKLGADFLAVFVGGELEIVGKVQTIIYDEAEEIIIQTLKDNIKYQVIAYIDKEAKEIIENLEYKVTEAARKMKRGWDNTKNFGQKLIIAIEGGLGHHSDAMRDEIQRQVDKLVQYKSELIIVLEKFEKMGFDEEDLEGLIDEVTDPEFKKRVDKWFGPHIDHKSLKKELMLDIERYERRIEKLDLFLKDSYAQTIEKVKTGLVTLNQLMNNFYVADIPDDFKDSKEYKLMVKKIEEVQDMIGMIENIINNKKKLLGEIRDQEGFKAVIIEMQKQYLTIKKDFNQLYNILCDYVFGLPSTK
jgi:hypothetical protein